jgi:hypothetical protein
MQANGYICMVSFTRIERSKLLAYMPQLYFAPPLLPQCHAHTNC